MSTTGNLVPLRSIVADILNDMGVQGDPGHTIRYTQWALRGMRDVSLFFMTWVETKKITMTDINTIVLPEDFVAFIRIGVPYRGRLWTSTRDSNLLVPTDQSCGDEVLNDDDSEGVKIGAATWPQLGKAGGQNNEYYRLDLKNNRIILNGVDRTDVTLEYKSNGINFSGSTMMPRMAVEAIIAYIHWKRTTFDRSASRYDREDAKQTYMRETTKLRRLNEPEIDALFDALFGSIRTGIKR